MEGTTLGTYDTDEANTGDNKFQDHAHGRWHDKRAARLMSPLL